MGWFMPILLFLFMTLPSLLYVLVHAVLTLLLSLPIRPFIGGTRSAILSDTICVKFLTPAFLLVALPVIFYFYVWVPLAWIFFGWMLIYFILRRTSGVSKQHAQLDQSFKQADRTARELQKKTGKKNIV